jgi:hypothetical protein|tara:strand:+ start:622 stop:753 length:132 start_codon:yes stop_codon:yes gene_type:complete
MQKKSFVVIVLYIERPQTDIIKYLQVEKAKDGFVKIVLIKLGD